MYFGATFDFHCDRKILDIQSAWNAKGPYAWSAFENEHYGVYMVTRQPDIQLKIRVLGEQPNYSLEIHCEVPSKTAETTKATLLSTIFDQLFPIVEATAVRDTSRETLRDFPNGND
jgi:hypothetical protein